MAPFCTIAERGLLLLFMASKAVGASYAVLLSVDRLRLLLEISQPICLLFDDIGIFLLLTSVQMVCPCEHARMRSVCTHVCS